MIADVCGERQAGRSAHYSVGVESSGRTGSQNRCACAFSGRWRLLLSWVGGLKTAWCMMHGRVKKNLRL